MGGISMRRYWTVGLLAAAAVLFGAAAAIPPGTSAEEAQKAGPTKTVIVRAAGGCTLVRDGKPFFIMGAGGERLQEATRRGRGQLLPDLGPSRHQGT